MNYIYFNLAFYRDFLRLIHYVPNGKGGVYGKPSQKKRRKMRRRMEKGRRKR